MPGRIWEIFGYRADDRSVDAVESAAALQCPYLGDVCEKRLSDRVVSGVCSIKPATSEAVICCPIRLYAEDYKILRDVSETAFGPGVHLVAGPQAIKRARQLNEPVIAVFGKRWGRELRLPKRDGVGGYFVDWVLAKLDASGRLEEFVAVEVQTIDTTGNYREGRSALLSPERLNPKTTAGLNWENVSKRILPQLIYKGQVLQREDKCRKGLFFVCPKPVYERIVARLGGISNLPRHPLQPASITFMPYAHDLEAGLVDGFPVLLKAYPPHNTAVYRVQEAFNNVTLPEQNVYGDAILSALGA